MVLFHQQMLNLAAFVNTFRKEDDDMMKEIHEEKKIITVWLNKNESADSALRDRLTKECVENDEQPTIIRVDAE